MAKSFSLGNVGFNLTASMTETQGVARSETPMRIALLGDFSGRGNRPGAPPASRLGDRNPIRVDRDNLEQVLGRFGVTLQLSLEGQDTPLTIRLAELDDFHPDRLFQRLPLFQPLRELLADVRNPATFPKAAAMMRGLASEPTPARQPAPTEAPPEEAADLFKELFGDAPAPVQQPKPTPRSELQSYMKNLVAPHLLPQIDLSKQAELESVVAEAASRQMRAVLHHPHFQAIEAAWRAAEFLVRRLETGPHLQIYLLDLSKAELAADLRSSDDLGATGIYRTFVEQSVGTPGGQPWGILAGLYAFDQSREDVETLVRLALIAKRAGAPFLAEGSPRILGCSSLDETPRPEDWKPVGLEAEQTWQALRHVPEAAYIGLALPRLLLRLPYGKDATPVESFPFEEMPAPAPHESYLWGNPAIGCVCLLAEAFSREGWDLTSDLGQEITELPMHVYNESGASCIKPCAEALLGERAVDAILGKGLMPILSVRDQDTVRLARFQSVAEPATRLAGRWKE